MIDGYLRHVCAIHLGNLCDSLERFAGSKKREGEQENVEENPSLFRQRFTIKMSKARPSFPFADRVVWSLASGSCIEDFTPSQ
jgi:hypothetical protein